MICINSFQNPITSFYILTTFNTFGNKKEPIRICTQFQQEKIYDLENLKNEKFMQIYVYTANNVYFNVISVHNLNRQLSWNEKFFDLLKKSFNNKNKNTIIEFNTQTLKLKLYSEFDGNSIRILLFEADLINLHKNPLKHAQQLCRNIIKKQTKRFNDLEVKTNYQQNEIEKIDILKKEISQTHDYEVNQIKQIFISVLNDVKKKLRPHFGIEQIKEQTGKTQNFTRSLYRIKASNNKGVRANQNFMNLFQ